MSTDPTNSTSANKFYNREDNFDNWPELCGHSICRTCHALVPALEQHELAHLDWHAVIARNLSALTPSYRHWCQPCHAYHNEVHTRFGKAYVHDCGHVVESLTPRCPFCS